MGRIVIHTVNGFMLVLFVLSAVVQYNDPDPLLWIAIYGAGALCCVLFLTGWLPITLSLSVSALCFAGALYLLARILFGSAVFFDETGREMMGIKEPARELLGFLITAAWTGFLTWRVQRTSQAPTASSEASS